jgi:Zn-dependent protease
MEKIYYLFCVFAVTLGSMILHELAHGLVALWQGDKTAKEAGRLSLNPIKHIDPVMTIIMPVVMALIGGPIFGGAKPVPINTRNLKHAEWSFALVAIAGPLTNFILAFLFYLLFAFTYQSGGADWLLTLSSVGISVNLGFMLFNIIPIPPLDGSRVLYALAPDGVREFMVKIETYGIIIIYALILIGGTAFTSYFLNGRIAILNAFYWIIGVR